MGIYVGKKLGINTHKGTEDRSSHDDNDRTCSS